MDQPDFHRLANCELNEAAGSYELESPGLGSSFLKQIERCLQSIADHPEAGTILLGSVRRRRSDRGREKPSPASPSLRTVQAGFPHTALRSVVHLQEDWQSAAWAVAKENSPCAPK